MTRQTRPTRDRAASRAPKKGRGRLTVTAALVSLLSVGVVLVRFVSWAGERDVRSGSPAPLPRRERIAESERAPHRGSAAEEDEGGKRDEKLPLTRRLRRRRFASAFVFATLFFAGAALAAVGGNAVGTYVDEVPACGGAPIPPPDEGTDGANPCPENGEVPSTDETVPAPAPVEPQPPAAPQPPEEAPAAPPPPA
ncbi:MAG: hypothetical protein M3304_00395, partial [Actinomycetota bacterium]|nr:hypothetical protein [Actinomycetota bacterium]